MPRATLKRIHVNQHNVRANARDGGDRPVFTIKVGRSNTYAHGVEVTGTVTLVYRPCSPLSCGARAWVETRGEVRAVPKLGCSTG